MIPHIWPLGGSSTRKGGHIRGVVFSCSSYSNNRNGNLGTMSLLNPWDPCETLSIADPTPISSSVTHFLVVPLGTLGCPKKKASKLTQPPSTTQPTCRIFFSAPSSYSICPPPTVRAFFVFIPKTRGFVLIRTVFLTNHKIFLCICIKNLATILPEFGLPCQNFENLARIFFTSQGYLRSGKQTFFGQKVF